MIPASNLAPVPSFGEPVCAVQDRATLGEGPLWSDQQRCLYWVDLLGGRLKRHRPQDGSNTEWELGEEISALAERRQGPGLAVTLRRGLALFDPEHPLNGVQRLASPEPERSGNRFNDGKCDSLGRFWAGSMDFDCKRPTGALYRFEADGSWTRHEDGFAVTNGPTWTLDERTLLFNDTVKARVCAYDFDRRSGTLGPQRTWLTLPDQDGTPDGMCTDALGRIWIAHWGGWCVSCHDPRGARELARIRLPVSQVTSCAFGDDDLRTLYITSARTGLDDAALQREPLAGSLFRVRLDAPGRLAHRFAG